MPRDPLKPRRGKREARRREAIKREVEAGRLHPQDLLPTKSVASYTLTDKEGQAWALSGEAAAGVLSKPAQPRFHNWKTKRRRTEAPSSSTDLRRPEDPVFEAVNAGRKPPSPQVTDESELEPQLEEETEEEEDTNALCVSVDLHNCLDNGQDFVPDSCTHAYKRLQEEGFIPFICSYIGLGGPDSQHRNNQAEDSRLRLASALGLPLTDPGYPSRQGVHLALARKKVFNQKTRTGGKAQLLRHFGAWVHIDDSYEVLDECESAGILCYQVTNPRSRRHREFRSKVLHRHPPCADFPTAVAEVIANYRRGALTRKAQAVWEAKSWDPPPWLTPLFW